MDENVNVNETQFEVTDDVKRQIEETVARIKEGKPELRKIYPIVVEGTEWDDKPLYIGYFRQPTFKAFSKYLAASQRDNAVAMRALANDCFLEGDKELVDDDSLFLFGLMGQLSQVIEMRNGQLVNLSKTGK